MIAKRARAAGATTAIFAASLAGCAGGGRSPGAGAAAEANAFAAMRVTIHPLTRIIRAPGTTPGGAPAPGNPESPSTDSGGGSAGAGPGAPTIVAHVAFADAWGFEVRALAELRLTLGDGPEGGDASWTFDLTGPEENARRYDRVTRTYELPLPGTPDWVVSERSATTTAGGVGEASNTELSGRGARGILTLEAKLVDGRALTTSRRLDR